MWQRNDGSDPINAVQNRFTAYLTRAIGRQRSQYIRKKEQKEFVEIHMDPMEHEYLWPEEVDLLIDLSPLDQMENQQLLSALMGLTERDRYILLANVLDARDFNSLSRGLGLGYKGVAAAYYRAVRKIRREMRGDDV